LKITINITLRAAERQDGKTTITGFCICDYMSASVRVVSGEALRKGAVYMTNAIPRMRTIKEVSSETGISYHCIRQWCIEDRIVYIKAGNKYLVNLDRFVEFLNMGAMVH